MSEGSGDRIIYVMPKIIAFIFIVCIWLIAQNFIPATAYWRDSGEFIISAYYLDVAHPAGFPLYSQLANLFALLPLGPIAWRINSFSLVLSLLNTWLGFALSYRILCNYYKIRTYTSSALAAISLAALFFSPSYLMQSYTTEVYMLSSVLLLILLNLYEVFLRLGDLRWLALACLIGGLALGNHVSVAIPIALVGLLTAPRIRLYLMPTLLGFSLLGLSVYAYIPVRAAQSPPLNTGAAADAENFLKLITDARDRALKSSPNESAVRKTADNNESSVKLESAPFKFSIERTTIKGDLRKMSAQIGLPLILSGTIGLVLLAFRNFRLGAALLFVGLGNWLFFHGWQADPWIPLFTVAVIGVAVFMCELVTLCQSLSAKSRVPATIASCALPILSIYDRIDIPPKAATALSSYEQPADMAHALLASAPFNAAFLSETTWFQLKYLRDIEGYRSDVVLVYQPRILFPNFFEPTFLTHPALGQYDSAQGRALDVLLSQTPNISELMTFSNFAKKTTALIIEPNMLVNQLVEQDQNPFILKLYSSMLRELDTEWGPIANDARHHLSLGALHATDQLAWMSGATVASDLLAKICIPLRAMRCSSALVNQLAVLLARQGKLAGAATMLQEQLELTGAKSLILKNNLARINAALRL